MEVLFLARTKHLPLVFRVMEVLFLARCLVHLRRLLIILVTVLFLARKQAVLAWRFVLRALCRALPPRLRRRLRAPLRVGSQDGFKFGAHPLAPRSPCRQRHHMFKTLAFLGIAAHAVPLALNPE